MRGRTNAGIGDRNRILVGLGIFDQTLEIGGLQVLSRNNGHRHVSNQPDIFEGVQRVVGKFAVESGACRHADVVKKQRVTVRFGIGHAGST
jgi:hypothetical protein